MKFHTQLTSVEAFDQWIWQAEQIDRDYEYIAGDVFDTITTPYASAIGGLIGFFIIDHLKRNGIGGFVTGANGGYQITGERYIPDVAYVSPEKQARPSAEEVYGSIPPDLAVEVISGMAEQRELNALRIKTSNYLASGVLVWIVNPEKRHVEVHQAGQAVRILSAENKLDGGEVLPGFSVKVAEIFDP